MFVAGSILTAIGSALTLVSDGWLSALFESAPVAYAITGSIAALLKEIAITLGLVLIGASLAIRTLSQVLSEDDQPHPR